MIVLLAVLPGRLTPSEQIRCADYADALQISTNPLKQVGIEGEMRGYRASPSCLTLSAWAT